MPNKTIDILNLNSDVQLEPQNDAPTPISVIIPCYNEGEAVTQLAEELDRFKAEFSNQLKVEFIIIDDGSDDDTWIQLNDHFQSWENTQLFKRDSNQGLSAAILLGIELANNELVGSMDSDCTYHPRQFAELVGEMDDAVAMVTASPYHPEGEVRNVPEWRVNLSRGASRIYRLLFRQKIHCYTCCFRLYRKSVMKRIQLKYPGYAGTAEMVWRIEQQGHWQIKEVPSVLNVRKFGQSKCRVAVVALNHLKLMAAVLASKIFSRKQVGPKIVAASSLTKTN